jgi:hypothetical protein
MGHDGAFFWEVENESWLGGAKKNGSCASRHARRQVGMSSSDTFSHVRPSLLSRRIRGFLDWNRFGLGRRRFRGIIIGRVVRRRRCSSGIGCGHDRE